MEEVRADLIRRLRKIEGQVKGIQRMIDDDKGCVDVLTQLTAVRSAVNAVGAIVVENHTKKCIVTALEEGEDKDKAINDLILVLTRFTKG